MPLAAAAVAASTAGSMYGADRAASAQRDAASASTNAQLGMFNQSRQDQMPWMQAGQGGLNALMSLYGFQQTPGVGGKPATWAMTSDPSALSRISMMADPGYQFRLSQGQKALENSAAARGGLLSGNTLRAINEYGQNFASNEFGNIANRLGVLAGVGQSTGQNLGQLGANTATNIGNNMMTAGAARASGYTGVANAMNNGVNNAMGMYGLYKGGFFG